MAIQEKLNFVPGGKVDFIQPNDDRSLFLGQSQVNNENILTGGASS